MWTKLFAFACAVTWRKLISIQRVLGSKAIVALPVIATAVATFPNIISDLLVQNWRLHCVFWGSLIFILAQALVWRRQPIEFKGELNARKLMPELISITSTFEHFQNRVKTLQKLVKRFEETKPEGLPNPILAVAARRAVNAGNCTQKDWRRHFPGIEVSIRALRDYDTPNIRASCVLTSLMGGGLMFLPTLVSLLEAIYRLLKSYVLGLSNFICTSLPT